MSVASYMYSILYLSGQSDTIDSPVAVAMHCYYEVVYVASNHHLADHL